MGEVNPSIRPKWPLSYEKPGDQYAELFWRPYLGNTAFALWSVLKALDLDGDGYVETPVTIQELAALIGVGDRYTILGRNKTKSRSSQVGMLQRLGEAGLVNYSQKGPDKFHRRYVFWVLRDLPQLTPDQLQLLKPAAQEFHMSFIGVKNMRQDPNYYTKEWLGHNKEIQIA
jgi:hypothetical protein